MDEHPKKYFPDCPCDFCQGEGKLAAARAGSGGMTTWRYRIYDWLQFWATHYPESSRIPHWLDEGIRYHGIRSPFVRVSRKLKRVLKDKTSPRSGDGK